MRKLVLSAAMLAVALIAAAPALAQSVPVSPDAFDGGPPGAGSPGGPPGEGPGAPPSIRSESDAPAGGPPGEGPGIDKFATGPPDENPESLSMPAGSDTPTGGSTSEGLGAPVSCEALEAMGLDMGCNIPPALENAEGEEAGALEPEAREKKADADDLKLGSRAKRLDVDDLDLGDEEEGSDPEEDLEQEAESGDVDQTVNIINTGDNVNMCIGVLQAANTGNSQNQQGVLQDGSEADEIELEGGSGITITPQLVVDCRQTIMQAAVAADRQPDRQRLAKSVPGITGVGPAAAKTGSASVVGQPMVGQPATALRGLPRTGGVSGGHAALLGLGAGTLLIAGGLLARRVFW